MRTSIIVLFTATATALIGGTIGQANAQANVSCNGLSEAACNKLAVGVYGKIGAIPKDGYKLPDGSRTPHRERPSMFIQKNTKGATRCGDGKPATLVFDDQKGSMREWCDVLPQLPNRGGKPTS